MEANKIIIALVAIIVSSISIGLLSTVTTAQMEHASHDKMWIVTMELLQRWSL